MAILQDQVIGLTQVDGSGTSASASFAVADRLATNYRPWRWAV